LIWKLTSSLETLVPASSVMFVLVRNSTPNNVLPEIEPHKPRVLRT
jgi:uncharacterized membrane protein